jgi:putative FmdB family regulatory protein
VPIYDYVCASCKQLTEVIHGIDAPGPRFCPACGAEGTLRKALTTPAVHFKGSGWAKKDRSSAVRARAGASLSGDGDGAAKAGEAKAGEAKAGEGAAATATSSDTTGKVPTSKPAAGTAGSDEG